MYCVVGTTLSPKSRHNIGYGSIRLELLYQIQLRKIWKISSYGDKLMVAIHSEADSECEGFFQEEITYSRRNE